MNIVKIKRYSPHKLTPPYEFILVREVEYSDEELSAAHSDPSRQHYFLFNKIADRYGLVMKFWSMDSEDNGVKVLIIEDETTEKLSRIEKGLPVED